MALDKSGNAVNFGDYLMVEIDQTEATDLESTTTSFYAIVRVVKLSESPKGVSALGAFVDLVGNGRMVKVPVDLATAKLVLKSDGTEIENA